jgi:DNA-binding transcriptional LysR family regulator
MLAPHNVARFKSRQLMLVLCIGETGSLRQAAEMVFMSQSAATRLLHELEQSMDVSLFERSSKGMLPTPAGELMIDHCRAMLTSMKDAFSDVKATAAGQAGTLRVGVFGGADPDLVASVMARIRDELPGLRVSWEEAPLDMLLAALKSGELDMVVSRMQGTDLDPAFRFEVVYVERFVVVCGVQNAVGAASPAPSLADLVDKTWILPPASTQARHNINTYFVAALGALPSRVIESASPLGSLALLKNSDAVGVMPSRIASFMKSEVRALDVSIGDFARPVIAVTLRDRLAKRQVDRFLELLRQAATGARGD